MVKSIKIIPEKLNEDYNLAVEWRPFEIHPETPKGGALIGELPP
ncbi:MAG: hypothetical protein ACFE85_18155 [Candidatus Hodarchaeota archaeon]